MSTHLYTPENFVTFENVSQHDNPTIMETSGRGYDRYFMIDSMASTMMTLRDRFGGSRKVHPLDAFLTSVDLTKECGINALDEEVETAVNSSAQELEMLGMNDQDLPRKASRAWPVTERILSLGLHRAVLINDDFSQLFPHLNPMEASPYKPQKRPATERVEKKIEDKFPRYAEFIGRRSYKKALDNLGPPVN